MLIFSAVVPEFVIKVMRVKLLHVFDAAEAQIESLAFRAMVLYADQILPQHQCNP